MRRLLYILIPTLLLTACLKEEYVHNNFEEQLVVEGSIEQDGVAKVMLTLNMDFQEEMSEESLSDKIVKYAVVCVTDLDSNEKETLIGMIDKKYPTQYLYRGSRIVGRVGGRYRLDIEYSGRKWHATTTIPAPNDLYDIVTEPLYDSVFYRIKATIKPNAENLPYMIQCATAFTSDEAPIYFPPALFGIINNCEKEQRITINRPLDYTNVFEYSTLFLWQEDVYIRFCTMSQFGYDYWSVWENCTLNSLNPIFPVDEEPPTNISGGAAGIWMGYGVSYYRISPLKVR